MQRIISGSPNISAFGFSVKFNTSIPSLIFDISDLTEFINGGNLNVQGICFSVVDSGGATLLAYDWSDPQIPIPSSNDSPSYVGGSTYTLDMSFFGWNFLFQQYKITGAIKDENGTIYELVFPIKSVKMPTGFTDYGYVNGCLDVTVNCANSLITVKETTLLTYCDKDPADTPVTDGTLYYPIGTRAAIPFTFTPFSNSEVYTGTYRVECTTTAKYDFGDDFYVLIDYTTIGEWEFDCQKHMEAIMCCISDAINEKEKHCGVSRGAIIEDKLKQARDYILSGIIKEMSGQDASYEAKKIKKILNCNCGKGAIKHVQPNPINTSISFITITGVGGTTVTSSTAGNTTAYLVKSNIYQVLKGNVDDLGWSIAVDTSTPNNVKYKITFDYAVIAQYIASNFNANNGINFDSVTKYFQLGGPLVEPTSIPLNSHTLQFIDSDLLIKMEAGKATLTAQTILAGKFPNTRNDFGTGMPVNLLSTDENGNLNSGTSDNFIKNQSSVIQNAEFNINGKGAGVFGFSGKRVVLQDGFGSIWIGLEAGGFNDSDTNIGIGLGALYAALGIDKIGIGDNAGFTHNGKNLVAIGHRSAFTTDNDDIVVIGINGAIHSNTAKAVMIGSSTTTGEELANATVSNSNIILSSNRIGGLSAFITATGVSVGYEGAFNIQFLGTYPAIAGVTLISNLVFKGRIIDSNTVELYQSGQFTDKGTGSFVITAYEETENIVAIGHQAYADRDNQVSLGNEDTTQFKAGAVLRINTEIPPTDGQILTWDAANGEARWMSPS